MTKKQFLDHPYDTEFESAVVDCREVEAGRYEVILENTLFYPESGGQLPDVGTMADGRVLDVRERGDDVVHNVEAGAAPSGVVNGRVDWSARFDHMQQHTGQHVLSRAFIEVADLHTVSFHMGSDTCTIDVEGNYDEDAAARAESLANDVIEQNRPLRTSIVAPDDLDSSSLRRKVPDGVTDVRIVEIDDFDAIPCCGTHVRSTSEVGVIKVLRSERVKQYNRIYFKCGRRARADYTEKHELVSRIATRFTTSASGIVDKIEKLAASEAEAVKRSKRLAQRLSAIDAGALLESAAGGVIVHVDPAEDASYIRMVSNEIRREPGTVSILACADGTVICAAADDVDVDIAGLAGPAAREVGGSGGGKGGFAQLKIPADVDMKRFLERIADNVRTRM